MDPEKKKIDKRLRKIRLRSELFDIEAEEFEELDGNYIKQFKHDFELEMRFLGSKRATQKPVEKRRVRSNESKTEQQKDRAEETKNKPSNESLKKLHKQLAFELHPDRKGKENHEEFLMLQSAWENQEYDRMLDISLKLEMDLTNLLDDASVSEMERKLNEREKKLSSSKRNLRWVWCQSDRNDGIRNLVRRSLGIRNQEFEEWLRKQPEREEGIERNDGAEIGTDGPSRKALP
jgi:hypothetical protein